MRKVVVSEFISVDGVYEDPGGAEGTKHGGWSLDYGNEEYGAYKFAELKAADLLLVGRKTYDGFAEAWPNMKDTGEFGEIMNSLPKYVVTSNADGLTWNNSHQITGNIVNELRKLKAKGDGDILVGGSGQLVRYLLDNELVDKLCLMIHPVVIGYGKQLLYGTHFSKLKLINSKVFNTGAVVLEYEPVKTDK